jgi:glycosyltransferase involved in cell wall biosynthesis
MKILYLCFDPSIDLAGETGGSVHIRAMIRALTELGHEVMTICSCVSRQQWVESQVGGRVTSCAISGWNGCLGSAIRRANRFLRRQPRHYSDAVRLSHNARFFRAATEAVRRFAPDFIYERYSLWGLAGFGAAKRCRLPFVLEVNAPLVYEQQRYRGGMICASLARRIEGRVWRGADLVIAVSEALSSHLMEVGVNSTRVQVLPNGVDSGWFLAKAEGLRARKHADLENCFVVGFVGSFKRWHGADFLLAAFEDFHRSEPSSHLLLIGDGPLKSSLQDRARQAGLEKAVTFTGVVAHDDIPRYLATMDVAVAPYPALENFYYSPLKLFEYMAAGRAVVASRTGQIAQVLSHGVNGLLYEAGDQAGLVNCLYRLAENPALREELGRNARSASQAFTWERNAARVVEWAEPKVVQGRLRTVCA